MLTMLLHTGHLFGSSDHCLCVKSYDITAANSIIAVTCTLCLPENYCVPYL